jgi:hypothetical protein
MQQFAFFDTIFNDVSLFLDVSISLQGNVFRTTAVSDEAGDLRDVLCQTLFSDLILSDQQQTIVDTFMADFNDGSGWLRNSVTDWPMSCSSLWDDGETLIEVKVYTLTDGNRTLDQEVIESPPIERTGDVLIGSLMKMTQAAVEHSGLAVIGFIDPDNAIPVMEALTRGENYTMLTFSPQRGPALQFPRPLPGDPEAVVGVEFTFVTDLIRPHINLLSKAPTFGGAITDHGVTVMNFTGPKNLIFSMIAPFVHAVVGMRPLAK